MQKINTFLIGAQKAGTTSLYEWLGQHPQIYAPMVTKDHHFFSEDNIYEKGKAHINSFYDSECRIYLHAAVNYLYFSKKTARRLYSYNHDAKFLICLRDPVERAISAYKFFVHTLAEDKSFENAIERELNGQILQAKKADHTYLDHGHYTRQINDFLNYFNKEQIHLIFFEELMNEDSREAIMNNIFQFLDVAPYPKINYTYRNKSGKPKSKFISYFIIKNKFMKKVKNIIPFSVRRALSKIILEKNISDKAVKISVSDSTIRFMRNYFEESNNKLERLSNKDLSKIWQK